MCCAFSTVGDFATFDFFEGQDQTAKQWLYETLAFRDMGPMRPGRRGAAASTVFNLRHVVCIDLFGFHGYHVDDGDSANIYQCNSLMNWISIHVDSWLRIAAYLQARILVWWFENIPQNRYSTCILDWTLPQFDLPPTSNLELTTPAK